MKTYTLLIALLFAVSLSFGQSLHNKERSADSPSSSFKNTTEISNVGDFTVVDSDGITWNLYTLLEGGTTVIIDLFQST